MKNKDIYKKSVSELIDNKFRDYLKTDIRFFFNCYIFSVRLKLNESFFKYDELIIFFFISKNRLLPTYSDL